MRVLVVLFLLMAGCGAVREPVPSVAGKRLADAVGVLAAAGYPRVRPVDASGRGRDVLLRRDWEVCGQRRADGDRIELDVVRVGESCPAVPDQPEQADLSRP
ncbi:MAG: hypothetical protein HOY71_02105 [Nonomuraea sp.]|nr:hypothetical protein [Nonomuraea sp.]